MVVKANHIGLNVAVAINHTRSQNILMNSIKKYAVVQKHMSSIIKFDYTLPLGMKNTKKHQLLKVNIDASLPFSTHISCYLMYWCLAVIFHENMTVKNLYYVEQYLRSQASCIPCNVLRKLKNVFDETSNYLYAPMQYAPFNYLRNCYTYYHFHPQG